jgi:hypothetical protein
VILIIAAALVLHADEPCRGERCDRLLAATMQRILGAPQKTPAGAPPAVNKEAAPLHTDEIEQTFPTTPDERARLAENGFFVSARYDAKNYAYAFHAIHKTDLPVFVSMDAIFHAVYLGHSSFLDALESEILLPRLASVVQRMRRAARSLAAAADTRRDVAIYLGVAARLLGDESAGTDPQETALVDSVLNAEGARDVTLFGRTRTVDFSVFWPRGHYAEPPLDGYFRGVQWLSQLTLNLQSRDCQSGWIQDPPNPEETPRDAELALALARLVGTAGVGPDLERVEKVLAALVGRREDVGPLALAALVQKRKVSDAAGLRAAIGDRFARTMAFEPVRAVARLPVVFTLLGPRITGDNQALYALIEGWDAADLPGIAAMLGHDRAKRFMHQQDSPVEKAHAAALAAAQGGDLYARWLAAILGIAEPITGATPTFMRTTAFADMAINTALVAYAQLRHNYVLYVGQPYRVNGCKIPDGFVEPRPAVLDRLIVHAEALIAAAQVFALPKPNARCEEGTCDPAEHTRGHLSRLQNEVRILRVLRRIVQDELAGTPLDEAERDFLAMVVSLNGFRPTYKDQGPPKFDGWYPQLLSEAGENQAAELIVDVATAVGLSQAVHYLGAGRPKLGYFVVDTGGPARLMVGPVASGYALTDTSGGPRLTDVDAEGAPAKIAPWTATYVVPAPDGKATELGSELVGRRRRAPVAPAVDLELDPR